MAGSASLDSTVLVDSLVPTVDSLRDSLHAAFGVRHFRVFVVTRVWSGGMIGSGSFVETALELSPRPMVEPFTEYKYKLEPCGLNEAGYIKLSEISLTYTEAELVGTLTMGTQLLWKISEGHGQATRTRYFIPKGPPYPDRVKNIGWQIALENAQVSVSDSELEHIPVTTITGSDVVDITGEPVWSV